MDINPEIRERILNAAQQLFEASGRLELPTVDAVRRLSKTNMVKFQQRYVMSHRNVVNCLWDKAFGQFGGSHGGGPFSRSVLGA
jgi:hypothetical protein